MTVESILLKEQERDKVENGGVRRAEETHMIPMRVGESVNFVQNLDICQQSVGRTLQKKRYY